MVSIVDIIRTISGQLSPAVTFEHGEGGWNNLQSDDFDWTQDAVFLNEPITSNDIIKEHGLIEANYSLELVFARKSELDYTSNQHEPIIQSMRVLAKTFVTRLVEAKDSHGRHLFSQVDAMRRVGFKNMMDVNVSGCLLFVSVIPFDESSLCLPAGTP